MANFVDELAATAEKMGEGIGRTIDGAKLKWAIMRLESELEGSYLELGKLISDNRGRLAESTVRQRIAALLEKIDRQKEDIAALKGTSPKAPRVCGACGKTLKKGYEFCPFCGKRAAEPAAPCEENSKEEAADAPSADADSADS